MTEIELKHIEMELRRGELNQKPLLAEYGTLRKEIEDALSEISAIERYVLIGAAAVWTWLLTNPNALQKPASPLAWLIPFVVALFGGLKSLGLYLHVTVVGEYIETTLESPLLLGWQAYFKKRFGIRFLISCIFWLVLLVVTLLAAWRAPISQSQVVGQVQPPNPPEVMAETDFDRVQFVLLAIAIALSAYLGSVFIKVRETISALKKEIGKRNIELLDWQSKAAKDEAIPILEKEIGRIDTDIRRNSRNLQFLLPADIVLVILAVVGTLRVMLRIWLGLTFPILDAVLIGFLGLIIGYLAFLHIAQWPTVIRVCKQEREHPKRKSILNP